MKKGRRAIENTSNSNTSSDSPSTPDYDLNLQENALPDDRSPNVDFKAIPLKTKQRAGWTDEPVRSASSGKYVINLQIIHFCVEISNKFLFIFCCSGIEISPPKVKCKIFVTIILKE